MKNKMTAVVLVLMLIGAGSVFSESFGLGDLQKGIDDFSGVMAETLPFNSAIGLSWADAYIGNFPHFGVGLFGGASFMDSPEIDNLLKNFDISLPLDMSFVPLPAAGAEARLGGFLLPFDIGLKFGWLPPINFSDTINLNYMMVGGDIRYAIMKGNLILPKITIGVGYNYIKGSIGASMSDMSYGIDAYELKVENPHADFFWSSNVIDFKLQVSKTFFFITPFVGAAYSYSWSEAGYEVKADTSIAGGNIDDINSALTSQGLSPIDLKNNGFSSIVKNNGWNLRFFGGLGFSIAVIKIDLTAMYEVNSSLWNAGIGFRFQI